MITNPNEYWRYLYLIQDKNNPAATANRIPPVPIPEEENRLAINLNTRIIEAPEYLSVQYDHDSETVFFEIDRYFDGVDLANMCCVIQYVNAGGDGRFYPVPFYDTLTKEEKLIFPWQISGEVTKYAGTVEYAVRFYSIDFDNQIFNFNLNTQPAKSKILHGMNVKAPEIYEPSAEFKDQIWAAIARLETDYNLYWLEVKHEGEL